MNLSTSVFRSVFGKAIFATAALGGFLLFAGAPAAKAADCDRGVAYSEFRYHRAVERFGPYSRDARYWAHERQIAFVRAERCRRYWR
jgi:hypothetical protein